MNTRPPGPEPGALPTALHPDNIYFSSICPVVIFVSLPGALPSFASSPSVAHKCTCTALCKAQPLRFASSSTGGAHLCVPAALHPDNIYFLSICPVVFSVKSQVIISSQNHTFGIISYYLFFHKIFYSFSVLCKKKSPRHQTEGSNFYFSLY